ncbi:MAG: hypothetical protein Q9207_004805 [Kuettlingeria erythrocarpa]
MPPRRRRPLVELQNGIPNVRPQQSAAQAATNSTSAEIEEQPFPLMALAVELRELVYGEILRPNDRDHHDKMLDPEDPDEFEELGIEGDELQVAIKDAQHQTNFLNANKQVEKEATKVWYNKHWFIAVIRGPRLSMEESFIERDTVLISPGNLDKIRNLQITLKGPLLLRRPDIYTLNAVAYLKQLCYEFSNHCPLLRNVVVQVPCVCSLSARAKELQYAKPPEDEQTEDDLQCPSAAEWEDLLHPLGRLRVTMSIRLETTCRNANTRIHAVFSRITAQVRSSRPIPNLIGNERTWYRVRSRAFLTLTQNERELRRALHEAHLSGNIPLALRHNRNDNWNDARLWQGRFRWWIANCDRLIQIMENAEKAAQRRSRRTRRANRDNANDAEEEDEAEGDEAVAARRAPQGRVRRSKHRGEFRKKVPKGLEIDMNW